MLDKTSAERTASGGLVDLEAPVLAQVGELGSAYHEWVHHPIRRTGGIRIFRSDWLERLSQTPWWVVPALWGPVATVLLTSSVREGLAYTDIWPRLVAGIVAWTVLEYALHRFVFHYRPRGLMTRRAHFLMHGVHHLDPSDSLRLVFPPIPAAVIVAGLFGIARLLLPFPETCAVMTGLLIGYMGYDLTHYYVHHGRPRSRLGRFLQRYHLMHHFADPSRMFGVSQPLIDLLGGTFGPRPDGPRPGP